MNPNAREFKFNAGASEWKPPFTLPPQPPTQPPVSTTVSASSELKAEATSSEVHEEDEGDEPIDENDPLWQAAFKIAGTKEATLKLLDDADGLMKYPEIRKILEAQESADDGAVGEDDWESSAVTQGSTTAETETETEKVIEKVASMSLEESSSSSAFPTEEDAVVTTSEDEVLIEEEDPREHLNIVFIGHVDAGKSTLSGSILYTMGKVDKRTIEKFEREAKQRNRESWFLAYILDESEEERAKGITIEVGRAHFETSVFRYTILDAPGHKNYVPNMIAGAAQADVGVLVISARKGEFETGFEKGGQTREHALLAKTLGVQYLIVVVNKMDDPTVEWDVARYEECVGKLKPYLKSCGYTIKTSVKFLPIAGLLGDNINREVDPAKCPWWKGMYTTGAHNTSTPTLLSTLDSLKISGRNPTAPLRIPCLDRYFDRGTVVMGKVESGTISRNDEIAITPTKKKAKVEAIYIDDKNVRTAKPGENVLLKFQINVEDIQKGYVLCSPHSLCPAVTTIKVQLALVEMLEHRPVFSPGYDAVMHVHTVEIEVTCTELVSVMDKGRALKRPFARQGQQCICILTMPLTTCMETFATNPSLGRFTIRDEGKSIAIGKIVELIK